MDAELTQGAVVDQELKKLMKELGEAINESLAESDQIADVVSRIKEGGYDIFLVLEATIGFSKQNENAATEKTTLVTARSGQSNRVGQPDFSDQDRKFLRSLRIKIDDHS